MKPRRDGLKEQLPRITRTQLAMGLYIIILVLWLADIVSILPLVGYMSMDLRIATVISTLRTGLVMAFYGALATAISE
jgi:hypothetical protein